MSNQQTDNSRELCKIEMREELTKEGYKILDCYHGNGIIWNEIKKRKKIKVVGIEKEKGKGAGSMYGKCEKIIPSLDLSLFDIIDFDAWGSPYKAMKEMFRNKTLNKNTLCFYTFIQTGMGSVETELLKQIGITEKMSKKCHTMYKKYGFEAFKMFLYNNKIKEITNWNYIDGTSIKNYGYFYV